VSGQLVPQDVVDRANEDIVGVIRGYLPDLKKTGKNWSARCPFHKEKSASFTVNEGKEMYYCFGCGAGGDAVGFVMNHQSVNFREAVQSILGELHLEDSSVASRKPIVRATRCDLPGHAEDREKAAQIIHKTDASPNHAYLLSNNTSPEFGCFTLKGSLIVPLINNIGETVNVAAIKADGSITYAAGNPSFGSTAILEPAKADEFDGVTILCVDYAHAWRIWWARGGKSKVLACLDIDNLRWMLMSCKERFTHIGCDPSEADEHIDYGREVFAFPLDPYAKVDRNPVAE
jgi:phage/plasmid primase-like uncharacterized protein